MHLISFVNLFQRPTFPKDVVASLGKAPYGNCGILPKITAGQGGEWGGGGTGQCFR